MSKKSVEYFKGDELAANVWLSKYAQEGEKTPDDMHKRMAKEFARIEQKYQVQELQFTKNGSEADRSKYGQERKDLNERTIFKLFKDFKYIIPQGSIMSQLGTKSIGSLSNCFVIGQPLDSYGGIFQKDQEMAQLMKRRGGVGIDISTLRPEGASTSNAAKSSTGAISFMHRFSNTTREVAQNGRRGALMISIDINHPDVMEFIKIKRDLSQVTGANISIKLNDEFMKAVEKDEDYILRFPCELKWEDIALECPHDFKGEKKDLLKYNELTSSINNVFVKKIKAKEYWDEIIKSAHSVAEPGLMFWDAMVNYSPDGVYEQFKQITTNPCSEIGMQPYDACRLIAVNLYSFVDKPFTDKANFNFEKFYEINYEAMRLSDDLIDLELEHIEDILNKIDNDQETEEVKRTERELWLKVKKTATASRRTGLGFTALGDTLAALNLKYDSKESLEAIDKIMKTKMESELDCTIDLSILRGTFEGWDKNLELNHVIEHSEKNGLNNFYQFIFENFQKQAIKMYKYGRRNVSFSTVAPTGTVSLLAQTTSGIEPLFQPFYTRRKKVNKGDKEVRVDFTDQNGDTWQEFSVLHPKFKEWCELQEETLYNIEDTNPNIKVEELSKDQLTYLFEMSPWYGSTANDIDWVKRVGIQAIIQKYITHSISSTINLPENVSEETVSEIYLESWKKGLKGITVYRDGSRSGVLLGNGKKDNNNTFEYHNAPKRPRELEAEHHVTVCNGIQYNVIVGFLEGNPYEIFIDDSDNRFTKQGVIFKKSRNSYYFKSNDITIDMSYNMTDEQEAITRLVSTSLRHGVDIKFIVEQLNKTKGDLFSFTKGLSRVLKKYIPNGVKSTIKCNECGSDNVIFEDGCNKCLDCGNSKCG